MAQAIKRLYPEQSWQSDRLSQMDSTMIFDFETPIAAEDLEKIEAEMKKIIKEALPLERFTLPREEAIGSDERERRAI